MTDEELAAIHELLEAYKKQRIAVVVEYNHIEALLAEVDRLRAALRREQDEHATCEDTNARRFATLQDGITRIAAENAALREIVTAVASLAVEDGIFDQPFYALWSEEHCDDGQWFEQLVLKARALLGKE